ncbi:CPBP family intramembrane glutamic endopeptidase [Dyella sp. 2RAB6]|uniref:CPBP family intramembrane glutamic endopeptidase n=1 Tax=Dyella sp. 2RAB6 TaxID=3232992 RepID=UPI003F8F1D47
MPALPATRAPRLKLALVLGIAAAIATLALFPYLIVLMPRLTRLPMPVPLLAILQSLQSGALCGGLAWFGLWLGERYGLSAPWLRAWIYREAPPQARGRWLWAILLGVVSAVIVLALDWHGQLHAPASKLLDQAWRGALASFYGGIAEETLCRLFLVSLLVWLLARLGNGVRPWMFVLAIVLAAVLFGVGHLPAAFSAGIAHGPLSIGRIIVLNTLVGLPCGWLFWKYGLEHAMVAHFSADLVLHVGAQLALAALA